MKLPKILQWFTGNIGFHHIHHLAPRIPNYRLENCYREVAALRDATKLSLRSALCIRLALWDEDRQRFVRFKDVSRETALERAPVPPELLSVLALTGVADEATSHDRFASSWFVL